MQYDGDEHDFTNEKRDTVIIKCNKLYEHKVVHINYTTYNLRPVIMVLAHEDEMDENSHPYWYTCVTKILHSEDHQMDVLFVRWLSWDTRTRTGFAPKHLPCIGFLQGDTLEVFGFLDPDPVICGAHLIPAFAYGR
ncbi:hypothetical protein BV22DRAFT_1108615 [Leucogyrophana mollusca]|uniref:Uncharacterized protein n=1 Tax=Leucogyrophana mollusca TaxID=85980 RepID=A0ACB8AWD7_9AGAM|nr:hypothetical protein BV22DRAFT_1108615 [Leucogyrophana mollusca]